MTPPHMAAIAIGAWFITLIIAGAIGAWAAWGIAFDRGFEEAAGHGRHRHRIGAPQETTLLELPRAGRLALEPPPPAPEPAPVPEWMYFGAPPAPPAPVGPAEYRLMTRQSPGDQPPGTAGGGETPSAWTRRQALEMDAFIKTMVEESCYFQHMILAGGSRHSRPEGGVR